MRHYLTYFDVNYLTRGLALYRSLERHAGDFHLWIVAFDEDVERLLTALSLPRVSIIPLREIENQDLLRVKPLRTRGEYCWTCTPATLLYALEKHSDISDITYLDADLLFFSNPEVIFEAARDASIILTEHRWMPGFDLSRESGRFAVQFVTFRRDPSGIAALRWWYERCIEWCYARFENGKFGDQKYLDDWPTRFSKVHVDSQPGVGIGPWNCAAYAIGERDGVLVVNDAPLVFFHFHGMRIFSSSIVHLYGYYPVPDFVRRNIYAEYRRQLLAAEGEIRTLSPGFRSGRVSPNAAPGGLRKKLSYIRLTCRDAVERRYLW